MTARSLEDVAGLLAAQNKGLLAIDESVDTCNRRFLAAGIPQTAEMRRTWRELLVTTPDLGRGDQSASLLQGLAVTLGLGLPAVALETAHPVRPAPGRGHDA